MHIVEHSITSDKDLDIVWITDKVPHADFVKALQEQMMGFFLDEIVSPMGQFHEDGKSIRHPHPTIEK
uniref:Uncharacterized protein n=1 Tax=Oryza punctata TaxID=4537 RepID=A0A0E0KND7_ORYPU